MGTELQICAGHVDFFFVCVQASERLSAMPVQGLKLHVLATRSYSKSMAVLLFLLASATLISLCCWAEVYP